MTTKGVHVTCLTRVWQHLVAKCQLLLLLLPLIGSQASTSRKLSPTPQAPSLSDLSFLFLTTGVVQLLY